MAEVVVAGAAGRMGSRLVALLKDEPELRLVAALEAPGHAAVGRDAGESAGVGRLSVPITDDVEAAIGKAVGMFAFALWDREERVLSLVRDRFGEKPLYYGWAGKDFIFGSELKSLRLHPAFDGTIDRQALGLYAARAYVPAPRSIYRSIFKLEPDNGAQASDNLARLRAEMYVEQMTFTQGPVVTPNDTA